MGEEGELTRKRLALYRSGYLGKRFEQRFPVPDLVGRGSRKGFQQGVMGGYGCQARVFRFHSSAPFTRAEWNELREVLTGSCLPRWHCNAATWLKNLLAMC